MKIAIFSDCYLDLTGGITSSINAQKQALEDLGHTVYVFSSGYPRPQEDLRKLASRNIFQVPSCRFFIRGVTPISRRPNIVENWLVKYHPEIQDFDVFYIHYEAGCSIAGMKLAKRCRIPIVQVMHGREDVGEANIIFAGFRTIVASLLNWAHSWYIPHKTIINCDNYLATTTAKAKMWTIMVNHANYADVVLTPSDHFRQKLIHYGVKKDIKVFPNGIADENFPKNPEVKKLEKRQTLRMIWHSRVSGEKRIMAFLQALRSLDGDYRLSVYGNGGDLSRAKRYASRYDLNVVFHGNTDYRTITVKLPKSHLDILASYNFDTFGMTLIEAESYGVPVFFCDPDMQEIVPPGSFVMSADPSPAAIADALNDLLAHPERIEKMSQIMLKHRDEVLISNRIKSLIKIFNGIIKK